MKGFQTSMPVNNMVSPPAAGLGDGYITIGHGIIDAPPIFVQNRTSDCSSKE